MWPARLQGPDPTYYLTSHPETIPFEELPEKFVVKPTHGSGWVRIVSNTSWLKNSSMTAVGKHQTIIKLFVFGGQAEMIRVDTARFTDHRRRLFTPVWQKLDVLLHYDDICGDVPRPPHLGEMIVAAETLGKDLDFLRVDFYMILLQASILARLQRR